MDSVVIRDLVDVVEAQHRCRARFSDIIAMSEVVGHGIRHGGIYIFDLDGHSTATVAYAWSSAVEGSARNRFHTVLHGGPIQSAEDAFRISIMSEHQGTLH